MWRNVNRTGWQVVLAGSYPPPFGGESIHVWKLASLLRSEGRLQRVVNLRRGAPCSADCVNGAGPIRFWWTLMRELSGRTMLHLHANGHSWKSWARILCAACVLRLRRTPAVLTIHSGLSPQYLRNTGAVWACFLRYALTAFTQIVCVNDEIRQALVRLGVSDKRLSIVPAFLGTTGGAVDREDEALLSYRPRIVAVANDGPEYGVPLLIEAISRLRIRYPAMGCIVIGTDGAGEAADLVRTLGLSEHVRFLGQIPHARCLALVARSHLFVRPSLADGDSVSVREALSMGIPVIASETGARPPETILFRMSDSADLEAKIVGVLDGTLKAKEIDSSTDFGKAVLAVYAMAAQESPRR